MCKITQRAEPVIDGDEDDVFFDEAIGLIKYIRAGARLMRAAVNPDHDRQLLASPEVSGANVEVKAIFTLIGGRGCGHCPAC